MTTETETPDAVRAKPLTMAAALNSAMRDALAEDPNVVIYGEDVGPLGGVFRITDGLTRDFGEQRVWDSPLAESGIVGTAIGMAMYGMRPIVEMQFDAFSYPAFEQIVSHVAKMRNRTRGRVSLPIVIRIPTSGGIGGVEHHSDSSEAYWTHTPGLTVVTPSNPADAYSMLREAIRSDDPVIFLEPKSHYWMKESTERAGEPLPMNRAAVVREGTDVTLISYGPTVAVALATADLAAEESLSIEVIDLRSLSPFDDETVGASVRRTGRAAVIHEAAKFGGYGAEVAARITEREFFHLAAPVLRITGADIPFPAPLLEKYYLPNPERILHALSTWEWDD
ncbi:pyruvate dehydrogenase E1 component beta subunit [Cryobacterium mesophilum]|uniref:3-methyl-2-oxobutanoate dehydrogenase (2-methylpropanoyl-transferring) n=1 Tax=Terrimesophilobacter mesophilus TaxID=433647 RepID=A0A4R8VGJ8_9MICO|nr:alpha-ketoacid dehydrogenase subunit beta [Terrimesophilobacter mesophilus]MBB5634057.1 pyruvate dehydrogenase E1 component beta subunit [Terrimesophilobacter mesophilus]TFB81402.1 alpha-ketoacid dehydrogenase subunit beta [Terrimesophilobacter mesophilus]